MIVKINEGRLKGRTGKVVATVGDSYIVKVEGENEIKVPVNGVKVLKFLSYLLDLIISLLDKKPAPQVLGSRAISNSKKWYFSKTLWAAAIAFIATVLAEASGIEIDNTVQAAILSLLMIIFRTITKEPIEI